MGRPAINPIQEFNGLRYYTKPNGYFKADYKLGGEYMHRAVWKFHNGDIPEGFHVHHKDNDKSNNDISNLECISAGDHQRGHAIENHAIKPETMQRGLLKAIEVAKIWHASPEGRAWHSEHAKEQWKDKEKEVHICANCSKEYDVYSSYKKRGFCSAKCQTDARYKSGVDNIQRACAVCAKEFTINKYSKTKTCGDKPCVKALRQRTAST